MTDSVRSQLRSLHVVVAGGGIAGVETLLALRALTGDALSLTLVSPAKQLNYRPFAVLEPFASRAIRRYDLGEICDDLEVTHRRDALAAVDRSSARSSPRPASGSRTTHSCSPPARARAPGWHTRTPSSPTLTQAASAGSWRSSSRG
jgi:hypothetical protein